jgi:dTDP-glucose 4,6-dehydratase
VTGGAGFIGSNFVRHVLAETPVRLVIIDKLTYAGSLESLAGVLDDERARFVQADIADRDAMEQVFRQHRPAAMLNFAAETHVDRSIDGPAAFVQTNVVGTFQLLDVARAYYGSLDPAARARFRFLHVSTDEVYGSLGDEGLFSEDTPYAPNSPYSATKAGADHLVRSYHHTFGLPTIITNCSNNYGPFQFPEKLIPLTILQAIHGRPLPIYGTGSNVRDWLHVEDHCSGIRIALQSGRPGGKYNIGGGNERTNLQVVDTICALLDRILPVSQNDRVPGHIGSYGDLKTFVQDRPGHDARYAIDSTRVQSELGWRAKYHFDSGLEQTVRWYLDNEAWCDAVRGGRYAGERLGLAAGAGSGLSAVGSNDSEGRRS